ncbi:3-phytase [Fulvitalea axinellae]|uniref:3-phytase n=1 Tax=Fulvitalea axinellae TaxID=1182444 RepID=A0AAU9DFX0_9BACT|nr:3-phytase [Fulvitalea axinellae]
MKKYSYLVLALALAGFTSCGKKAEKKEASVTQKPAPLAPLEATVITDTVFHDTDDPAIWYNANSPESSLIVGTDKDVEGAIYAFGLDGKTRKMVRGLNRPNNVDIEYGFVLGNDTLDIAVFSERGRNMIRVYSLPALEPIDNGGIPVFEGDSLNRPMGVALYKRPTDNAIFAIVGRKDGPQENYLWQYELKNVAGAVAGEKVREFGAFSGKKEIEAICVDDASGFVYYSDEQFGIRKYYADPEKGAEELALFGQTGFQEDIEGISIYTTGETTGYILVSDQQANKFRVFPREGAEDNANNHPELSAFSAPTLESDGSESISQPLGEKFPKGFFVAMSSDKTFKVFDWRDVEKRITKNDVK